MDHGGSAPDLVRRTLAFAVHVGVDILTGLLNITGNIEGITGSFRDGETVVESDATRDGTESTEEELVLIHGEEIVDNLHNDTPHLINSKLTDTGASGGLGAGNERLLKASCDNQGNNGSSELPNTLHGEHSIHHGTSPLGGSELRGNDAGQWIITTDSNTLVKISSWPASSFAFDLP